MNSRARFLHEKSIKTPKSIKRLMQKGVINLDVISNETLIAVILTEFSHEQIEDLMKDWNVVTPTSTSNDDKREIDQ